MNNYDEMYDSFKQAQSEYQRQNFNIFMNELESGLIEKLNQAWIEDKEHYEQLLSNVKSKGIRVFRNEKGEHKVKFA